MLLVSGWISPNLDYCFTKASARLVGCANILLGYASHAIKVSRWRRDPTFFNEIRSFTDEPSGSSPLNSGSLNHHRYSSRIGDFRFQESLYRCFAVYRSIKLIVNCLVVKYLRNITLNAMNAVVVVRKV